MSELKSRALKLYISLMLFQNFTFKTSWIITTSQHEWRLISWEKSPTEIS